MFFKYPINLLLTMFAIVLYKNTNHIYESLFFKKKVNIALNNI